MCLTAEMTEAVAQVTVWKEIVLALRHLSLMNVNSLNKKETITIAVEMQY